MRGALMTEENPPKPTADSPANLDDAIQDLCAANGEIFVPIATRITRWEAEDAEREKRQGVGIKKAMASLDRGLGIEHHHVEAWVVSLNSDLERLVEAVE